MNLYVEVRHRKGCAASERTKARCTCRPGYRVRVWDPWKRKQVRSNWVRSLAEAKNWRDDALARIRQRTFTPPDPRTVGEAASEWLAGVESGAVRDRSGREYKPSTARGFREKLDRYLLPALGAHRLTELRRRDVLALNDHLMGEGLSPSSVSNTIDPLRCLCRSAIQRELITVNPTSNLGLPTSRPEPARIVTVADALALIDALRPSERAIYATACFAGLRRGELQALRVCDIDLANSVIRVERGWDQYDGPVKPKSANGRRSIPLNAILRDYLDEHLLATGRSGDDLVFGRTPGHAFVASTLRSRALRAWEATNEEELKRAEREGREPSLLTPIKLHALRHTYASLLIAMGENPKAIQTFMGHATISMTFDRYGHLMPGNIEQARERMDAWLEQQLEGNGRATGVAT
jgi:integrase